MDQQSTAVESSTMTQTGNHFEESFESNYVSTFTESLIIRCIQKMSKNDLVTLKNYPYPERWINLVNKRNLAMPIQARENIPENCVERDDWITVKNLICFLERRIGSAVENSSASVNYLK